MSTSTRVILDKKVRVLSNYLYVKIGGSTSILAPILEYYSSFLLGTRTRLQIPDSIPPGLIKIRLIVLILWTDETLWGHARFTGKSSVFCTIPMVLGLCNYR